MEVISPLVFGLIKYFGYFYYLKFIGPTENAPNIKMVATVRLVIGIVVGMSIYALLVTGRDIFPVYFTAILTGRFIIWYFIFYYFYKMFDLKKRIKFTIGGTVVSYLLDIPATMGILTIIGGIC